eukprot:scaffold227156_cov17-Tisochrysis_lutea.AAC.1
MHNELFPMEMGPATSSASPFAETCPFLGYHWRYFLRSFSAHTSRVTKLVNPCQIGCNKKHPASNNMLNAHFSCARTCPALMALIVLRLRRPALLDLPETPQPGNLV